MRNLQTVWFAALLAGCGGPAWDYDAPGNGPSLAVGSGGDAVGPSATSAGGSDAQGGTGGSGVALPFVGATGQGGEGGLGQGGGGGLPCEPEPNPCDGMPDGQCGDWADSCGAPVVCGPADACPLGILYCDAAINACACQSLAGYQLAVNTCAAMGLGEPAECGDDGPNPDIPPTCVDTGVVNSDGHIIWCCD